MFLLQGLNMVLFGVTDKFNIADRGARRPKGVQNYGASGAMARCCSACGSHWLHVRGF